MRRPGRYAAGRARESGVKGISNATTQRRRIANQKQGPSTYPQGWQQQQAVVTRSLGDRVPCSGPASGRARGVRGPGFGGRPCAIRQDLRVFWRRSWSGLLHLRHQGLGSSSSSSVPEGCHVSPLSQPPSPASLFDHAARVLPYSTLPHSKQVTSSQQLHGTVAEVSCSRALLLLLHHHRPSSPRTGSSLSRATPDLRGLASPRPRRPVHCRVRRCAFSCPFSPCATTSSVARNGLGQRRIGLRSRDFQSRRSDQVRRRCVVLTLSRVLQPLNVSGAARPQLLCHGLHFPSMYRKSTRLCRF